MKLQDLGAQCFAKISIEDMQKFVELARLCDEEGLSLRKISEETRIPQRWVHSLERAIDVGRQVVLVTSSKHGAELTTEGRAVQKIFTRILGAIGASKEVDTIRKEIRIIAVRSTATSLLGVAKKLFDGDEAISAGVNYRIDTAFSPEVPAKLIANDFHFGVSFDRDRRFDCERLITSPLSLILPYSHPHAEAYRNKKGFEWQALQRLQVMHMPEESHLGQIVCDNLPPSMGKGGRLCLPTVSTIYRWVKRGWGDVAFGPRLSVEPDDIEEKRLQLIPFQEIRDRPKALKKAEVNVYLLRRKSEATAQNAQSVETLPPVVLAFIECVRKAALQLDRNAEGQSEPVGRSKK